MYISTIKIYIYILKYLIVGDCQQIIFVILNRFCLLSNPTPHPPTPSVFSTDNIKMDRIPKPKSDEKHIPFLHCISSFEGTSYKNL